MLAALVAVAVAMAQEAPAPAPAPTAPALSPLAMQVELPQELVAVQLSSQIGFGAGHFYAEQPRIGGAMIILQSAAWGVVLAGVYAGLQYDPARPVQTQAALQQRNLGLAVGLPLVVIARAIDIGLAPQSARRTARERLKAR